MYSRMHTEEKYHMSKVEDKLAYCILVSKENRPQKWKEEVKEVDGLETQFISKRNIKKERIGRTEAKAKENDSKYFVCIRGNTKPENWKGFLNIRQISKHESFENEFNLMSGWVCQLLYSKHILIESSRLQMRWCSYYTHFTDEEVEAWRDPVGSARSHWQQGVQPFWQTKDPRHLLVPMRWALSKMCPFLQKAPRTLLDFQRWGGLSLSHSLSPLHHTASSTFIARTDRQSRRAEPVSGAKHSAVVKLRIQDQTAWGLNPDSTTH